MRTLVHPSVNLSIRQSVCNPISVTKTFLCAISGFWHEVDENRALLGIKQSVVVISYRRFAKHIGPIFKGQEWILDP